MRAARRAARRPRWRRRTATGQAGESILIETDTGRDEFMQALLARRDNGPERKLQKLIDFDENHAARNPQAMDSSRSERMKPLSIAGLS